MSGRRLNIAYFDTSVILKRYVQEVGSASAMEFLGNYALVSSPLAPIELASGLRRRLASAEITTPQSEIDLSHRPGSLLFRTDVHPRSRVPG